MVVPPSIVVKGVHWARDGPKFACKVHECNVSTSPNTTWYSICECATMSYFLKLLQMTFIIIFDIIIFIFMNYLIIHKLSFNIIFD
jgi:hypothetical protein